MKILANMSLAQITQLMTDDPEGQLHDAWLFTQKLINGYNPIRDHAADVHIDGCSRFSKVHTMDELYQLAKNSKLLEVRRGFDEGFGRAFVFVFEADEAIGETADSMPLEGEQYEIKKIHGCLQASGTVAYWPQETKIFSIVLSPQNSEGEVALATAHPGLPSPDPRPGWFDLKEGDTISAFQVLVYGARPTARKG